MHAHPRRRRWPYHVTVVLGVYALVLVLGGVGVAMWLRSDDTEILDDPEVEVLGIQIPGGSDEATSQPDTGQPDTASRPAPSDAPVRDRRGWRLVWHDEFRGPPCPDPSKWSFEHGFVRNGELQWYQPGNASCERGILDIRARREETPRPNPSFRPDSDDWRASRPSAEYTSASLISKRSFDYGRLEMRGRIDTRPGSWPAFWTLGAEGEWPRSGEVDILEYYRGTVLANVCKPKGKLCGWSSTRQSVKSLGGENWARRFHVWAMEWSARRIDLFLDGKGVKSFPVAHAVGRGERNPYVDNPQSVLLSQAIGGANGGDPSGTEFPVRFEVDYVRVYESAR